MTFAGSLLNALAGIKETEPTYDYSLSVRECGQMGDTVGSTQL
jgi:hypothetical protein